MKDKVILFDWGNVVESHMTGFTCALAWNEIFKQCGYNGKELAFDVAHRYKLNCIKNIEDFKRAYEKIKNDLCLNKSFDEFVRLYKRIFNRVDFYKNIADYEKSLKDRCYIGIFSDLNIFDKERLDKQVGLDNYDYVFLSFEMGLRKPDIETFEKVQSMLPFEPSKILFIDDREDNIESGAKIGWNTLLTTGLDHKKIEKVCEEFLKRDDVNVG